MSDEQPDFSEFEDWLAEGWDTGALLNGRSDELTLEQTAIIERNFVLLLNREQWKIKVERFERAITSIDNEELREKVRLKYCIHFDFYNLKGPAPDAPEYNSSVLDLSEYIFPCSTSFVGTTIARIRVNLRSARFGPGNFIIRDSILGNTAFFGEVTFLRGEKNIGLAENFLLNCERTKFGDGNVVVRGYGGDISLYDAEFGFGNVQFHRDFGNLTENFECTNFGIGQTSFFDCKFRSNTISFYRAVSGPGDFSFQEVDFGTAKVIFVEAMIDGNFLIHTNFADKADFSSLSVTGSANFSDCSFSKAPDFRNAKFDRPPEVARMSVPDPVMVEKDGFLVANDPDDVAKFRKLKSMALAANDHEMDGKFFAKEMMAKRGHETKGFWPLLLDSAYAMTSNYGQSVWLPILWMLMSFFVYVFLYAFLVLTSAMPVENSLEFAAAYSLLNAIPLISTLARFSIKPEEHSSGFDLLISDVSHKAGSVMDWVMVLGMVQQAIGAILLFLLFLGLRNRFRLK